jgi:isopenicillin N synthase-like dioxygenase
LPRKAGVVDSSKLSAESFKLTTPAHKDSGFITILSTLGFPGLEVLINGEFKAVRPKENHLVVNLGLTFEQMTNGHYKATTHRVLDIDIERFSMPFFLRPKYSAVIPSNFLRP